MICPNARGKKGCHCPTSYSRCLYWVREDAKRGDFSQGHGGWGWPDEYRDAARKWAEQERARIAREARVD